MMTLDSYVKIWKLQNASNIHPVSCCCSTVRTVPDVVLYQVKPESGEPIYIHIFLHYKYVTVKVWWLMANLNGHIVATFKRSLKNDFQTVHTWFEYFFPGGAGEMSGPGAQIWLWKVASSVISSVLSFCLCISKYFLTTFVHIHRDIFSLPPGDCGVE